MRNIVLIAHNLRSCHNIGSLLRTADGLGINKIFLTGYTPYPKTLNDTRLPHIATKMHKQIQKTALGAEETQNWEHSSDIFTVIDGLKKDGYLIAALEQTSTSKNLTDWQPVNQVAIIVGRETEGLEPEIIAACDIELEIPMQGKKESFNVVQAAAMALYHCKYFKI